MGPVPLVAVGAVPCMSPSTFRNNESKAELKLVARASRISFSAQATDGPTAANSRPTRMLRVKRRTIAKTRAVNHESKDSGKYVGKGHG
jgi:hypothetical protein